MPNLLDIQNDTVRRAFDREPVPFDHSLSSLEMFSLDSLRALAATMTQAGDYFLAEGAPVPNTPFFEVPRVDLTPAAVIDSLDQGKYRILLKRAEKHDRRFRELINDLFSEVKQLIPELKKEKIVRLESGILISSKATITPFHCDHEVGFFSQIRGDKEYHVFSPDALYEPELERFGIAGPLGLAPVELKDRDTRLERVFYLREGKGFHQPENSPHWVVTSDTLSISYTFVFETETSRIEQRVRAFNYYSRRIGLSPAPLGSHPRADALKASVMRGVLPVRTLARVVAERAGLR